MTPGPPLKHPYKGGKDWAFAQVVDIESRQNPGRTYLRRFIIFKTPWCGVYLHRIYEPDTDRDPHNHPMNFWSFILSGMYIESRWRQGVTYEQHKRMHSTDTPERLSRVAINSRFRTRFSIAGTRIHEYHSIEMIGKRPLWTLMLMGRRQQDWGFLTREGIHIPWRQYEKFED